MVLAVVSAALLTAVTRAGAAEDVDGITTEPAAAGVVGPVGVAAVILGIGGLVAGLLRRRRTAIARAAAVLDSPPQPAAVAVESARGDTAA